MFDRRAIAPLFVLSFLWLGAGCDTADTGPAKDAAATGDTTPTDTADVTTVDEPDAQPTHPALVGTEPATFTVRPGVEIVTVLDAAAGQHITLYDATGKRLLTVIADAYGQAHFAYVPAEYEVLDLTQAVSGDIVKRGQALPPGDGYVLRDDDQDPPRALGPFKVLSVDDHPDPSSYDDQPLQGVHYGLLGTPDDEDVQDGLNYIRVRDGVELSAMVRFPDAGLWGPGPYPTVVEYSGYSPSNPADPDPGSRIATLLGYASVGVNMRGTGCSGGVFDVFSPAQHADGYDIIEVVARQPWVMHHKVGMVGLSYPGITQMYVAAQKPPSLAAIAAESVIASTDTTLLPGGILNDGFAISWVTHVLNGAHPYGQGWEQARVDKGDTVCKENQLLHSQMIDNVAQARQIKFYVPAEHDRFSPLTFVQNIEVPVFLSGQWQDEQTGPYFYMLFDKFTGSPSVHFNATNGIHPDGFNPGIVPDWAAFLDIYVAQRPPVKLDTMRALSPQLYQQVYSSNVSLGEERFKNFDTLAEAKAAWEGQPRLRVEFENGAGKLTDPGAPVTVWEHGFSQWPPEGLTAKTLYFGGDGVLHDAAPTDATSASEYSFNFARGATGSLAEGAGPWDKLPNYNWVQPQTGDAVVMESEVLTANTVMMGTASFDLWINSPVDGADVQVTLSEVRADGQEVYVQSGWLRSGHRKPGPKATAFWPAQTLMEDAWELLTPGTWTPIRIGTAGFAHAFRAGSKIRVAVDTPGGVRTDWRFAINDYGSGIKYGIGHDATHPSKIVLPVIAGIESEVPAALPACPGLRAQPCRPAQAISNAAFTP